MIANHFLSFSNEDMWQILCAFYFSFASSWSLFYIRLLGWDLWSAFVRKATCSANAEPFKFLEGERKDYWRQKATELRKVRLGTNESLPVNGRMFAIEL